MYRNGDENKRFYQSDRIFKVNGEFFFSTREGKEAGPFENMEELEWELAIYIRGILLNKPENMNKVA